MENKKERHYSLYVLLCEQDKFYVGITTKTPEQRMYDHLHGIRPANWTQKYKPLKIIQTKDLGWIDKEQAELYEKRVTRRYMEDRGVNNVRGGDLTSLENYIYRFGRFFTEDQWSVLRGVIILLFVILGMTIAYYLK